MAFKLIEAAQRRWRMVNAPHLVALVRAGATFVTASSSSDPKDEAVVEGQPTPPKDLHPQVLTITPSCRTVAVRSPGFWIIRAHASLV